MDMVGPRRSDFCCDLDYIRVAHGFLTQREALAILDCEVGSAPESVARLDSQDTPDSSVPEHYWAGICKGQGWCATFFHSLYIHLGGM